MRAPRREPGRETGSASERGRRRERSKRREEIVTLFDVGRNWLRVAARAVRVCARGRVSTPPPARPYLEKGLEISAGPRPAGSLKRFNRLQTFTWPTGFSIPGHLHGKGIDGRHSPVAPRRPPSPPVAAAGRMCALTQKTAVRTGRPTAAGACWDFDGENAALGHAPP